MLSFGCFGWGRCATCVLKLYGVSVPGAAHRQRRSPHIHSYLFLAATASLCSLFYSVISVIRFYCPSGKSAPSVTLSYAAISSRHRSSFSLKRLYAIAPRIKCSGGFGDSTDRKSTRLNSSHLGISYAVF